MGTYECTVYTTFQVHASRHPRRQPTASLDQPCFLDAAACAMERDSALLQWLRRNEIWAHMSALCTPPSKCMHPVIQGDSRLLRSTNHASLMQLHVRWSETVLCCSGCADMRYGHI